MHGAMFPRVPGLGLAPAMETRRVNARERDALLREALAREEAAYREPCPPAQPIENIPRQRRVGAAWSDVDLGRTVAIRHG